MHFKFPLYAGFLAILLFQGCRFSNDHYPQAPGPESKGLLIDSVRDNTMSFKVYDSVTMTHIGWETWNFQQHLKFPDLKPYTFMSYLVFREFRYDSSGGTFTVMSPEEGFAFIREFNKQVHMPFLEGRYPKWHPQDSLSSRFVSEVPGGVKSILTRSYKGVTKIDLGSKTVYAHRAGRDSSAVQGISPPFYTKREDYYFNEDMGLVYMVESKTLQKFGSDSLIYRVIKIRN